MRDILIRVVAGIAALVMSYLSGKYSVRSTLVTRTEYQLVEKNEVMLATEYKDRIIWKTVTRDGAVTEVIREVSANSKLDQSNQKVTQERVVVERIAESDRNNYSLGVAIKPATLGEYSITTLPRNVNVELGRRVAGPAWLTVGRIENGQLSLGVRVDF